ncbi:class II SORL domain-containing protein [Cloacibacillus evryensis]|uniref:Class II SORL domain-containing protein n=2 Tax=root TaxID=1 RepID=A0AAW5K582_9BACT|nr:class II SORL domain-containing protein [Cloacibacillus evryensis]EHL71488.1 desulfoferrodoxin ferrous iron-binding domain-containing protein [Synergistes sp. 3_1_syn1]EXG77912.1 desulfoferrodoxin ferrous iron-binding domain [Cloacibacillus evryensis DSM 19522]MCQ4764394.1 class II SORL domain-containing protein [Cloacibacillus evryensis]MCQ4813663.1 class II SORL domain-containing protein [Cloacibacillus evryensis]MEA5033901.1 class II SORL domain-containing protein [Cloacibacillus evryens
MKIGEVMRDGDFKAEKHVPTIEAPEKVKLGEEALVKVMVGQEIKHPNTPLHHIRWIQLYFKPDDATPVIEVAKFDYSAHSDTMNPDMPGCAAADPASCVKVKLTKSGTFIAVSYCNIHGLWESAKKIEVEA